MRMDALKNETDPTRLFTLVERRKRETREMKKEKKKKNLSLMLQILG